MVETFHHTKVLLGILDKDFDEAGEQPGGQSVPPVDVSFRHWSGRCTVHTINENGATRIAGHELSLLGRTWHKEAFTCSIRRTPQEATCMHFLALPFVRFWQQCAFLTHGKLPSGHGF